MQKGQSKRIELGKKIEKEIFKGLHFKLIPSRERKRIKQLLKQSGCVIIYNKVGTANRFNDFIEVHDDLLNHPDLYYPIIRHELEHTNKSFSFKDCLHDLKPIPKLPTFQYIKWFFKTKGTFWQLIPIYYDKKKKKIIIDFNHLLIYTIIFAVLLTFFWLIFNTPKS